jgi:hypothetical protein
MIGLDFFLVDLASIVLCIPCMYLMHLLRAITGEQNSPFYTFFPHFAGRMGLHFGDFPKFIFSEWGEGFGEAVWGNIRQNGVYSPFCVFF